jgi:hypothetical protein
MRNKEVRYEQRTESEKIAERQHVQEVYDTRNKILGFGNPKRDESIVPYNNALQKQFDAMLDACRSDISKVSNEDLNTVVFAIINDLILEAKDCNNHHMNGHTYFVLRQVSAIVEYMKRAHLDIPPQS